MAVTLYSTPTCGYCTMAKTWLRENNIAFSEFDVSNDPKKAEEMVKKSGQMGVPVLDVHGRIIIGFNQNEIQEALKR